MTQNISLEAVDDHLDLSTNHEAGLIPMSTQRLLRALSARLGELDVAYKAAREETHRMAVHATERDARAEAAEAKMAVVEAARIRLLNDRLSGSWREELDAKLAVAREALGDVAGIGFDAPMTFAGSDAEWERRRANAMQHAARQALATLDADAHASGVNVGDAASDESIMRAMHEEMCGCWKGIDCPRCNDYLVAFRAALRALAGEEA